MRHVRVTRVRKKKCSKYPSLPISMRLNILQLVSAAHTAKAERGSQLVPHPPHPILANG